MLPKWHILYGFAFSVFLFLFFDISIFATFVIFLSTILIDLDPYFRFIIINKTIHPKHFWEWSMERKIRWFKNIKKHLYKKPIFVFHGLEFIFLIAILSFINKVFLWIFIGFIFHIVLDWIHLVYEGDNILHKMSQIYVWQTNKNKKDF